MMYLTLFLIAIFSVYLMVLLWLRIGLLKIKEYNPVYNANIQCFSLIIISRNEAENLPELLSSIKNLDYPSDQFEVILVDDASHDNSLEICENFKKDNPSFQLKVVSNVRKSNSPKKDGIEYAVNLSQYPWIVATDADCVFPQNYLKIMNAFIAENNPEFIAGQVQLSKKNTLISEFQTMDWMSLIGFTIGTFGWRTPLVCSGANLTYKKDSFIDLDGFEKNNMVASGDDVFLLQKFLKKYPEKIHFLLHTDAVVKTKSLQNWKALVEQHKRWMSKTGMVKNILLTSIGMVIFISNLVSVLCWLSLLFVQALLPYSLSFLILKILIDFTYLNNVSQKTRQIFSYKYFILSAFIYPFFSVWVTLTGLVGSYQWKERKFKR